MTKKERLHELVKSLSKSEKRYFKLQCQDQKSANYLRLFEAIDKQDTYNEAAIKKAFKGEPFIAQLHVTKNYLQQSIMKALRNYHAEVSKDAELKDLLRNVEILFNKELYHQCRDELKRAEKIAHRFELLSGIVEVENWNRKLEQTLSPHAYDTFSEILQRQQQAINNLQNTNAYWQLATTATNDLMVNNEVKHVKHPLLSHPEKAATIEAKVLFYNTKYLLDIGRGKSAAAFNQLKKLTDHLEQYPDRIKEEPGLYVSTINNLLSYLVFNKQYDEALALIRKANGIYDSWKITAANRTLLKQIIRTYNIELEIYRTTNYLDKHLDFVQHTEEFVKANAQKMPKDYLISFWFQLASIYFRQKEFDRSLHWISKILNARFKSERTDLVVQTHLLNLIVHLELQNLMVLRYFVDSTRRFLRKMRQLGAYEEILLKFFIKIGRLPLLEYKAAFTELQQNLFPENDTSPVPDEVLDYIDLKTWVAEKAA